MQPHGPYLLGGHSMGGKVAYEMVRQLEAANESVAMLAIIDVPAWADETFVMPDEATALARIVEQIEDHYGCALDIDELEALAPSARYDLILQRMTGRQLLPAGAGRDQLRGLLQAYQPPRKRDEWTGKISLPPDELLARLIQKAKDAQQEYPGPLMVRYTLRGNGPLHRELQRDGMAEELRAGVTAAVLADAELSDEVATAMAEFVDESLDRLSDELGGLAGAA